MRHQVRAHHWMWFGIGLTATLLSARAVHDQMLAASQSDLARYCDSLDDALKHRVEAPQAELLDLVEHLAVDETPRPALKQLNRESHRLNSVWLLGDGETPAPFWKGSREGNCEMPPVDRIRTVAAAIRADLSGTRRVVPVETGDCKSCIWLVASAGPDEPLVLAEADLDELLLSIAERLASRAAGEAHLRIGQTVTPLLTIPETQAVDPHLSEHRELGAYGGLVTIGYEVRSFADAWTTLRPIVSIAVLLLGTTASLLLFTVLRVLHASAQREQRLKKLSEDLRRRDRDIQRRGAEAEAASAAKSNLLRQTSHNIRSPLTNILGTTDALIAQAPARDVRVQLASVRSSASHLLALANDLLDIARVESGRVSIAACDIEPTELLHEIIGGFRDRAESKGLTLAVMWESAVPATIHIDPTRLREILTNLIDNAIRHTSRGGITLSARIEEGTDSLYLDVIDTGEGIESERLAELLEADDAEPQFSPARGSCGIGLAITRHLTAAMGGTIDAVSREGLGTVFSLVLPVGPVQWRDPAQSTPTDDCSASVLVVDDAPEIRQFMRLVLGQSGLVVHVAGSGGEAQAAVAGQREGCYRLVFLDQHLTDTTGVELLDRLRDEMPNAMFVALTGDADPDAEQRYTDAGFDAYLPKPFTQHQLADLLERVERGARSQAA